MSERARLEIPLVGGRTAQGVVRVGDTVRKPVARNSELVRPLLLHFASVGFDGCPKYLGVDEQGRSIFSFIPGDVPEDLGTFSDTQLQAAARLLRAMHDASALSELKGTHEVVCHGDASPCNFVFNDGLPCALIDFDAAEPGDRYSDLGYAAWHWLDIGNDDLAPAWQGRRLARFFAGYDISRPADPVGAMLAAQARICSREGALSANKDWAEGCLEWTRKHALELQSGFAEAGQADV